VDFRDTARLIDEGYQLAAGWLASHPAAAGTGQRTDPQPSPGRAARQSVGVI
jgi:hypothetical protein